MVDARAWLGGALDSWESVDDITNWTLDHNCAFIAAVMSKKLQEFSVDKNLANQNYMIYFDYGEAHQACLDKLFEAQNVIGK